MRKEIEELKKRIEELEKRPVVTPIYQPIQYFPPTFPPPPNPNLHYHGSMPCYNNPCVWC